MNKTCVGWRLVGRGIGWDSVARLAGSNPVIKLKILYGSWLPFGKLINLQLFLLPLALRDIDMSLDLIAQ